MNKTFFSYAFGCRVNEAEKQEIDRQMQKFGYIYSDTKPDIYIINTCAVTQKAEREARQYIYQVKKHFPEAYIVVTGCSITYWHRNNLHTDLPINLFVENINKEYLVKLLGSKFKLEKGVEKKDCQKELVNNKYINSGRYLIKIHDGCQKFCTYCIVPYLRGLPKSIPIKSILQKISTYSDAKEIILTAINTEAYGLDTKEDFVNLIKMILKKTKVPRISFGSVHPWSINNSFINLYRKVLNKKRLVDFFHIPLQSGSNKILRLMKRGYSKEEFNEKLNALHKINPMALFATDIITGFLDEENQDFEDTYKLLEKSPISKFHIFRFSNRSNTAAWFMKKKYNEPMMKTKEKRAKILAELGRKKYQLFLEKHINQTYPGLVLKKIVDNYQGALLSNQIPVFVNTKKNLTAQIKNIKVIGLKKGQLFGKIV